MATNRSTIKADNNDQDKKTDPFPLFDLLLERIEENICSNFSLKECGLFAQTSVDAEKATAFLRLLLGAVDAAPVSYQQEDETKLAAIAILQRHPELLFRTGFVTDHYGRKIRASPYQLFCGTFDVWGLRKVHEEIIPNIEKGEALAQAHFQAQFPNCPWPFNPEMGEEVLYDDRNKKQVAQVIAQLQTIDAEITEDPCTNGFATWVETKNAVEALCQIYSPKEGEVIRTGLHFPLAIKREIYKLYDARLTASHDGQPNSWSWAQLAFFSREVIGSMEAALTSVDGQCVKTGFRNLDMEKGPDRSDGLFCRRPKGIPVSLAPISGKLGRAMFVDPFSGHSCFHTSYAGFFDWYYKGGGGVFGGARVGAWVLRDRGAPRVDNLWRTKAETYGGCYAATLRCNQHIVTMTNR